ncbi:mechanosensitive ion channel [Paraurantiacibacter namhicola]|uniref:Small-conductance mechanosensitive channel n=1 Tax=Paraurantiacibacter namhicola TaxID=645517 RepID=A0A1C7DBW0_9SPHN|nr:mechanosensitive ion channel [Paraurantiacibacter namhicola]ANU08801.1 hypothetical protein A6F65_02523 [Paraurantiacibacter namhicola]
MGNMQFDQELAMEVLVKIGWAVAILIATWLLAKGAKWAFAKLVDNVAFLRRDTSSGSTLGESLGKIVGLLIWLIGLLGILQVFELNAIAGPIDTLLTNVMDFVPNLLGAGLMLFVGLMVAKIVRDLVVTILQTLDLDRWANRGGMETVTGNSAISKTIGTIVYALIALLVGIAALNILNIESISAPASNMLQLIFDAIPRIIAAAILLGIGYVISKFVVNILKELMSGFGVDRSLSESGLLPDGTHASSIIARVAQIAIILFFAIAATRLLAFPELTAILNEVLALGSRVIFGAVVIGFGFLIANMLARVLSGTDGTSTAATIVKWATIVLFTFMGLSFTGVGEIITETAFSAIVIGGAVAGALAFGLGGREWAGRQLEKWEAGSGATPAPTATRSTKVKKDDPLPPGA